MRMPATRGIRLAEQPKPKQGRGNRGSKEGREEAIRRRVELKLARGERKNIGF